MREIPDELRRAPFSVARAVELGVSRKMLLGQRFVRVLPRVHRHARHEMTVESWRRAAQLALPDDARLTGISRIQAAGLDAGPLFPIRFVVTRDHHLDLAPRVFLHRTVRTPPVDDVGVTPAAAFLALCAKATSAQAIQVGDWLLRQGHMSLLELHDLAVSELWRRGAAEACWVLPHLDARSRSLPESALRSMLAFAGLPAPRVNEPMLLTTGEVVMGDLWFADPPLVVEYEGAHHQTERGQYRVDVDRYAVMRRHDVPYVQVLKEHLAVGEEAVLRVHAALVDLGYTGPGPDFTGRWKLLTTRLRDVVGERPRLRAS